MKLLLFLSLLAPRIDPGLEDAWARALRAWAPYAAPVSEVRWCRDAECYGYNWGGGRFSDSDRSIVIWPIDWPVYDGLDLTMEHEFGHALGLDHVRRDVRISIMNSGWDLPIADGPNDLDIADVRALRKEGL